MENKDSLAKTNSDTNAYSRSHKLVVDNNASTHSARLTSTSSLNEVSTMLKTTVHEKDDSIFTIISDEDEACADSGATDFMLPDKAAFCSYHPCTNKFVNLGDHNKCEIAGQGTAIFSLNGKTILVRDALHVPALRSPLYSLRRHNQMPGCGLFSYCGWGSFILFPNFSLQVDDTKDFLVSYKSIGRGYYKSLDYAQLRIASARPSTLIENDDGDHHDATTTPPSDDKMLNATPSISMKGPTTITDEDLIESTTTPLSPTLLSKLHSDTSNLPPI